MLQFRQEGSIVHWAERPADEVAREEAEKIAVTTSQERYMPGIQASGIPRQGAAPASTGSVRMHERPLSIGDLMKFRMQVSKARRRLRSDAPPSVRSPYEPYDVAEPNFITNIARFCRLIRMCSTFEVIPVASVALCLVVLAGILEGFQPEVLMAFVLDYVMGPVDEVTHQHKGVDTRTLLNGLGMLCLYMLLKGFVKASAHFCSMQVMIRGRRTFTETVHEKYMDPNSRNYYVFAQLDTTFDNVDQRFTNDIDQMFQFGVEFFFGGVLKPETGFLYNSISGVTAMVRIAFRMGFEVPLYSFTFWLVLLVPTILLSNFSSKLQRGHQELEASFRVRHSRVKLDAESINFYGGEKMAFE